MLEAQEYPEYLGKSGSCTLIEYKGACFIVCTRHQLGIPRDRVPNQTALEVVRFVSTTNSQILANIPVDSCIFVEGSGDEEYNDLLVFRAASDHDIVEKERLKFFPVEEFVKLTRHISWMVGYPSHLNQITYDPQKVEMVAQMFDCKLDSSFSSYASKFKRYLYDPKFEQIDGFSGGAIFSLVGETGDYEVVLDGIIVRAGDGFAHVVEVGFVTRALSK